MFARNPPQHIVKLFVEIFGRSRLSTAPSCRRCTRDGGWLGGLALTLGALLFAAPASANKSSKSAVEAGAAANSASAEDAPPTPTGGEEFGGDDAAHPGEYTIRTLTQTRWRWSAPDMAELDARTAADFGANADYYRQSIYDRAQDNNGLRLERVFLRASAAPTHAVSVKLLVDFAELAHKNQKKALKLAFTKLRATEAISVTVGLFKIPYSLLELLPIAEYEFADVGPTDDLIKDLGIGGRDIGAMVDITPLAKKRYLHLQAGVFQGDSSGPQRVTAPGILAVRATSRPWSHLQLGADCVDRVHTVDDWTEGGEPNTKFEKFSTGLACSADAAFTYKRFNVRAEGMTGKRMDTPLVPDHRSHTFSAAWGIIAYKIKLRKKLALYPALRAEWLDEDQLASHGTTTFFSGAMTLEFFPGTRLLFDLSRSKVQVGTRDRGADNHPLRPSATTGVIQFQAVL